MSQEVALLSHIEGLLWTTRISHRKCAVRGVDALLPLLESQPVNGSGPRLIHDPSDDGTTRRIIGRGSAPDIVEHVKRDFFSRFPTADDP
jgi:hypothetical protein